jgi:hypothetical protein
MEMFIYNAQSTRILFFLTAMTIKTELILIRPVSANQVIRKRNHNLAITSQHFKFINGKFFLTLANTIFMFNSSSFHFKRGNDFHVTMQRY